MVILRDWNAQKIVMLGAVLLVTTLAACTSNVTNSGGKTPEPTTPASTATTPTVEPPETDPTMPPERDITTLYVGPELMECTGVGPQTCMQVKEAPEAEWTYFYSQIEGFEYEAGYEYELLVEQQPVENPPADGSSIRWVLVEIVSKEAVDTGRTSEMTLEGVEWTLIAINDEIPNADAEVTATFESGQVNGKAACNSYFGNFEMEGDSLTFEPLGATRMACEESLMDIETAYLSILQDSQTFKLEGDRLTIVASDGSTLTFVVR